MGEGLSPSNIRQGCSQARRAASPRECLPLLPQVSCRGHTHREIHRSKRSASALLSARQLGRCRFPRVDNTTIGLAPAGIEAARIPGVTPAAVSLVNCYIEILQRRAAGQSFA